MLRLPGGEVHPVDGGDQSDGIAHGSGVHIVLDKFRGYHQRPGGQVGQAPGHTGVEDQIHAEMQAENLSSHGGVDLAHAACTGQNARCGLKEGDAGHGFHHGQVPGAGQGVELGGHGELQCDIHTLFQLLADCIEVSGIDYGNWRFAGSKIAQNPGRINRTGGKDACQGNGDWVQWDKQPISEAERDG